MSTSQCSACQTPLIGQGRFCGSCGAPVPASQVAADPLGRVTAPERAVPTSQTPADPLGYGIPSPRTSSNSDAESEATLSALGIPTSAKSMQTRSAPAMRDMDWVEGAVVALIALSPALVGGLGYFVLTGSSGLGLLGAIGLVSSFLFGGSMGFSGGSSIGVASLSGELFLTSFSVTLSLVSGLLLFAGTRRVLRRADVSALGPCMRRVTPVTALFIAGAVLLSAMATGSSWPIAGVEVPMSPPLMRVFFLSALLAAIAIGAAIISRTRFTIPRSERIWTTISAPLFGVSVLVLLTGSLALLGGAFAIVVLGGWDWQGLLLIPLGAFYFLDVAFSVISIGTLSGVGIAIDASFFDVLGLLGISVSPTASGGFTVWSLFDLAPWLGVVVLVAVNAVGVVAAAAMILRRRDAAVARRDLAIWALSGLVLGIVMVTFVGVKADVTAGISSVAGSASESGGLYAGISPFVIILLPLFSIGWWLLARFTLPRLPSPTLIRLSGWARTGL